MTNRQLDPGGDEESPPKIQIKNGHQMERTKLTDWKKLAKSKKAGETTEKRQKTSSNGQFKLLSKKKDSVTSRICVSVGTWTYICLLS